MQIQKLYEDIRSHREIFVRLPLKRLWRTREYTVTAGFLLLLLMFMSYRVFLGGVSGFEGAYGLMSYCGGVLFVLMLRSQDVIVGVRSKSIELLTGIISPLNCSPNIGVQLQEQQWFCELYGCSTDQLAERALALEEEWRNWQRICLKATPDDVDDFKKFYFSLPESGRFMTLLVGFFAVVATLIITLGATPNAYFELLDAWRSYLKFVVAATILMAYAALPVLGAKMMLREVFLTVMDNISGFAPTERGFYRYVRHMVWSPGVKPIFPERDSRALRLVEQVLAFFSLSPCQVIKLMGKCVVTYTQRVPFIVNFFLGFLILWRFS